MKKILILSLFVFITSMSFAQSATTEQAPPPKIYNLTFSEPEINFHYSNLEGIKKLVQKRGELTFNEVRDLTTAVDSLERNIIRYMKIQVDNEKLAAEELEKKEKGKKK